MQSIRIAMLVLALAISCSACGPLQLPMPARLEPAEQAAVDDAWNRALEPVLRLSTQELLDALLACQGYQLGVDKLTFRSEKRCTAGLVVMEIQYDRLVPADDLFTVTVLSDAGLIKRQDRYSRDEIESAYRELFVESSQLEQRAKYGQLPEKDQQRLNELKAREAAAQSLFPQFDSQEHE